MGTSQKQYVIGVDIGTQSTKALLVGVDGGIVAQCSASYRVDTPKPSWAEQWPDVWFDAVVECIRGVVDKAAVARDDIKGLCVSSLYGGAGVPVDAQIRPLYPCLIWMDRRATDEVQWVRDAIDLERLYDITGNGVDSYYGYTKILWIKNHQPDVWQRIHLFLPPNTYVNYRLCGEIAVDHSSAGNIGGIYDLAKRRWSEEMLDRLGIPARMMPQRLVESSEVVGGLLPELADQLGLSPGTPVVGGGVDAAVATLAAGVTEAGQHVAMIGTSMCWGYINQQVDARNGLVSMPYVYNGRHDIYVFGGATTAGASVSWFCEEFCQTEMTQAEREGGSAHQRLERSMAGIGPGADGIVFLPYLMGERSPIWDAGASGVFVGLSLYHTRAHLYRAVLEGVSYALRHNIEAGRKGARSLDDKLIVVGGAAQSDAWMQIIADITGFPVFTIAENVEASLGAAVLASIGVGLDDGRTSGANWVTLIPRAQPQAEAVKTYDRLFAIYRDTYPALAPIMHRLAQR